MDIVLKDVRLNCLNFLQLCLKRKVDELQLNIQELIEKLKDSEDDYCKHCISDSLNQHREVLDDVTNLLSQFGYID